MLIRGVDRLMTYTRYVGRIVGPTTEMNVTSETGGQDD